MEVSANVRRTEPTPRREQDGETYSAATRSRSTSTQPTASPSTATHTSCSRIARATRSAAPRVAHLSACSLDIAGTASRRPPRARRSPYGLRCRRRDEDSGADSLLSPASRQRPREFAELHLPGQSSRAQGASGAEPPETSLRRH